MTSDRAEIFGGVDTHKQVHVAAAVDAAGRLLATAEFDAAPDGYGELAGWLQSWGAVCRVGVEGTGSYGAGLARHLAAAGVEVVEVNRPNRQTRRRRGKSDTVDAEAAARAALSGEAAAVPKSADGCVEAIRTLSVARRSAVKARTVAANQIDAVAVTAPEQVKDLLRGLNTPEMIKTCARWRIGAGGAPAAGAAKRALRALARRHRALTAEIDEPQPIVHLTTGLEVLRVAMPVDRMTLWINDGTTLGAVIQRCRHQRCQVMGVGTHREEVWVKLWLVAVELQIGPGHVSSEEAILARFPARVEWRYDGCPAHVWEEFADSATSKGTYIREQLDRHPNGPFVS